jgi:hypothetical protein
MKSLRTVLFAGAFAAALGLVAAGAIAGPQTEKTPTTKQVTKKAKKAAATTKTATGKNAALGKEETISGTLFLVDATQELVFVKDASNTPFSFKVTKKTKIELNKAKAGLSELAQQVQKSATVTFVPMTDGNYAQHIEVNAG